ncbi:MAG: hypothetical protein CM1200mP11_4460 [Nitrosopumilaceae archaeon]|nr:MAG: hypothetical protein CM1200mP11_4460 [Nitrosopumilaceae archaeon]
MEEVQKKQAISLSEVKEILGKVDVEEMDQIQRWTYDYVSKFVTIDSKNAKDMKKKLIKDCELTEDEAVEIVNIRPKKYGRITFIYFRLEKINPCRNPGKNAQNNPGAFLIFPE